MIVLSDKYIWRIRIGFIAKVCIYIYIQSYSSYNLQERQK